MAVPDSDELILKVFESHCQMLDDLSITNAESYTRSVIENEGRPWEDWLEFVQSFRKPGKQGLVGLMKKRTTSDDEDPELFVFKVSQYVNHLAMHEGTVMKGLNAISEFCPHFCKYKGVIQARIDPTRRKSGNPFADGDCKHTVKKDVLLCQHIDGDVKLRNLIMTPTVNDRVIISAIKQVLLAVSMAQRVKRFTHYDLHSSNIMMKECDPDTVFVYALDSENQFCVPTYGQYPVIIDFGFSYVDDLDDGPIWPTLAHTDVGFSSTEYDHLSDAKLFLVSVSSEYEEERSGNRYSKIMRRVVNNIFGNLELDWDSGWDDSGESGISDQVLDDFEGYERGSALLKESPHYCIDLIQSMLILPLEEQSTKDKMIAYKTFVKEWLKIERQIGNQFYCLCIFKEICDSARFVRAAYMNEETRGQAIIDFRRLCQAAFDDTASYCKIPNIHFEKMLCSLLTLSLCIEGELFDRVQKYKARKQKEYDLLPLKSIEEIYAAVDANLPSKYKFTEKTTVVLFDLDKKRTDVTNVPQECLEDINECHPFTRGSYLYNMINGPEK